jgi:hypothetical protein
MTARLPRVKLAYIGGGSLFVPSIVNGVGQVMQQSVLPFEAELCLYDIRREKAARMQSYAEVVRNAWNVPVRYGDINHFRVLQALRSAGYSGPLAIEYCGTGDPDVFAEEDARYLSSLAARVRNVEQTLPCQERGQGE